eukprot:COSAG04_NODE_338_length_16370_cov_18.584230_9_plen_107_part_00
MLVRGGGGLFLRPRNGLPLAAFRLAGLQRVLPLGEAYAVRPIALIDQSNACIGSACGPLTADREPWAKCLAHDAACLPFGMVGELRRKLGPTTTLVLLLGMGVGLI